MAAPPDVVKSQSFLSMNDDIHVPVTNAWSDDFFVGIVDVRPFLSLDS